MASNKLQKITGLLAVICAFCATGTAQTHTPLADPIVATIPDSNTSVKLVQVASGMVAPTAGAMAPGDDDHLYVTDQTGQVYAVDVSGEHRRGHYDEHHREHYGEQMRLIMDVSSRIVKLGVFAGYDERGLLGIAFHPDFRRNGLFYLFTSEVVNGKADFSTLPSGVTPNCQSVVTEWRMTNPREDEEQTVDMASAREILRIDKPAFNHNGGAMMFGPDRMLYISLGDGGAANDRGVGHVPGGNAQTVARGNILGKIIRIDPLGNNSGNGKYGIPEDNPFAGNSADQGEIWAYGLRNPFRMSFDSRTGALWAGDVGQNDVEEVDVIEKGRNYGWPIKEGTFLFDVSATGVGFVYQNSPGSPANLVDPVADYDHQDGATAPKTRVAVIGGFVYRGRDIEALRGRYVFGDYSGSIGTPAAGHLFTLAKSDHHIENIPIAGGPALNLAVLGFAQDDRGEIYLLASQTGVVKGTTGQVLRLTSATKRDDDDDRGDGRHD